MAKQNDTRTLEAVVELKETATLGEAHDVRSAFYDHLERAVGEEVLATITEVVFYGTRFYFRVSGPAAASALTTAVDNFKQHLAAADDLRRVVVSTEFR